MKEPITFNYGIPAQKPYALYIHGLGSSAASGTKSSLARSLDGYEWLSPEITHNPFESESLGYETYWNAKFGHRCNEQAAKQIKNILTGNL